MWSALLGAIDIKYMPRSSVKGQVLTDLVAEFAEPSVETIIEKKTWMENRLAQSQHRKSCVRKSKWTVRPTKKDLELG